MGFVVVVLIQRDASQRSSVKYSEINRCATGQALIVAIASVAIVGTLCANIGVAVSVVSLQTSRIAQIVSSEEEPIVAGRAVSEI